MTYDPYRQPPSGHANRPPVVAGPPRQHQPTQPWPTQQTGQAWGAAPAGQQWPQALQPEPQQGWAPPADPKKPARWPYAVLAGAVLALFGAVFVAYDRGVILKDSGIEACEAFRDGDRTFNGGAQNTEPMAEAQYRELRAVFEDSRYDDIRDHGTKLMDVVWSMSQVICDGGSEGSELGAALVYMQPLTTHMTGLQSACADQGIIINLKPAGK